MYQPFGWKPAANGLLNLLHSNGDPLGSRQEEIRGETWGMLVAAPVFAQPDCDKLEQRQPFMW